MKTLTIKASNRGKGVSKYIGKTLELRNGHRIVTAKDKTMTEVPCEAGEADAVWYDADLKPGVPLSLGFFSDSGHWFILDHRYIAGTWITDFEMA